MFDKPRTQRGINFSLPRLCRGGRLRSTELNYSFERPLESNTANDWQLHMPVWGIFFSPPWRGEWRQKFNLLGWYFHFPFNVCCVVVVGEAT